MLPGLRAGGFHHAGRRRNGLGDGEAALVRKRRKGLYVLPNLVTLAALFAGFYSIVMAMNGRFDMAAVGIFCAMVLDSLDGRVARMTNTQSAFGEQMDSCPTWCPSARHRR
jgi:CDP-diacylglycerol--serine O-phosphatidyltransferase